METQNINFNDKIYFVNRTHDNTQLRITNNDVFFKIIIIIAIKSLHSKTIQLKKYIFIKI